MDGNGGNDGEQRADGALAPSITQPVAHLILIVEDEPLVRRATQDALTDLGYRVIAAANARAALAALAAHPDVNLMVTDLSLPGMNGRELAMAARAERPDLKVILATGYDTSRTEDCTMPVLAKPYLVADLAGLIERALAAYQ
jgi:CheY-like chemotaxis protein